LCAAHEHQQGTVLQIPIDVFLARPDVQPLPGFGSCRVLACTRLRYGGTSPFCKAHQRRWDLATRADQELSLQWWCRTESAVPEAGTISMRGLPPLVVVEVLHGLQQRCADSLKTHRAVIRPLCDELRRTQVGSITRLPEPTRRQRRDLLRSLLAHRRRGLTTPEAEQTNDVWDLRVFGHRGSLDFTVIDLAWLRTAAKRWVAEDLPRRRGNNAANIWQYTLSSLVELSTSLKLQRDDQGTCPPSLGRPDIIAFANRLAFLQQCGTVSLKRRIDILRHVRTVLTAARWQGLTRPGHVLAGLPEDFCLRKEDIPRKDRSEGPGRALPPEIMQQLCDGLSQIETITSFGEMRVVIELMMDTGRRPEETCELPWDCLERDKNGKYVLVYDDLKCQRQRREPPISDTTATLIIGQQQRARARYPDTPLAGLKLLPAVKMNPLGTKPFRTAVVNEHHRAWVDALPPLLIRHGGTQVEFNKANVFPYAYRHTYAQRHADAGVPVDVLRELLDHDSMDTTRVYYRVGAQRQREAVDKVTRHQFDRHGKGIWREAEALLDAERARRAVGQVAVPYGTCNEPTNVQAGGGACPFRFRCVGCDHFRTDVSYLPDLTAYLHDLLRDRERILAATDLEDWAKAEAMPSEEEIRRVKELIHRVKQHLEGILKLGYQSPVRARRRDMAMIMAMVTMASWCWGRVS
jgi:integrase